MTIFAAVRAVKITSMNGLMKINNHALRLDETSQSRVREGAKAGECLSASIAPDSDPRNVIEAFKTFKQETGAKERKGAPLGLHLMCVVSPEWISEAGDLHDRENPRNVQLMKAAAEWVETWAGDNSLINVRLDLDEAGGGVVDLIVTPTRESRGKPVISTSKALKELREKHGDKREYSSLQTDWAEFAKKHLDQRIQRGKPIAETEREHVNADIFKEYAEKAVKTEKRAVESREQKVRENVEILKKAAGGLSTRERKAVLKDTELSDRETSLVRGESALLLKKAELDEREKRQAQIKLEFEERERALIIERNKIDEQNKHIRRTHESFAEIDASLKARSKDLQNKKIEIDHKFQSFASITNILEASVELGKGFKNPVSVVFDNFVRIALKEDALKGKNAEVTEKIISVMKTVFSEVDKINGRSGPNNPSLNRHRSRNTGRER